MDGIGVYKAAKRQGSKVYHNSLRCPLATLPHFNLNLAPFSQQEWPPAGAELGLGYAM